MAHPQTPEQCNKSPGYSIAVEDSRTQANQKDFLSSEQTRETSPQTVEEFILPKTPQGASKQTDKELITESTPDPSKQADKEECIIIESARDASTQTSDDDARVLEQSVLASETSEESRKRKISNEQKITLASEAGKLPRTETSGKSDQSVSSEKGCGSPDIETILSESNHAEFERSFFSSISSGCSKSEESYHQKEELNVRDNSGDTKNLNTAENIASIRNISEQEKGQRHNSDTDVSNVTNERSADSMLAGPSTAPRQKTKLRSIYIVEIEKVPRRNQKAPKESEEEKLKCIICQKTISKHVEVHDEEEIFRCCRSCPFKSSNFNFLQMHIYDEHTKLYYCNPCQMKYSEMFSHAPDQTCDVCDEDFRCKYQLEEHYYSSHEEFREKSCRICRLNFDKHKTDGKELKKYQCCFSECKHETKTKMQLILHIFSHYSLRIFKCEVCGNHYRHPRSLSKHLNKSHSLCELCGERFINKYFLNEHHCEEE